VEVRFSQESSVPRAVVMDAPEHFPLVEYYANDMSTPVAVERTLRTDASLENLEETAKDMLIEFFWYFHFDMSKEEATRFLEYVKEKRVRVPRNLLPQPEDSGENS